jgi:hypothetical protein
MPARLILLVAVSWGLFGPATAFAREAAEATRVRILVVVDDDGPGAEENGFAGDHRAIKQLIQTTFRDLRLEGRYTLDVLAGKDAQAAKVLAYYRDLKSTPDEALLCYYSGHGGADPVNGHFLDLDDRPLVRSELRAAMLAKKPRLAVLLTDCCAEYENGRRRDGAPGRERGERMLVVGQYGLPLAGTGPRLDRQAAPGETLRQLLFYPRGVVDITACQVGRQAFSSKHVGGFFTLSLVALLQATPERFGLDPASRQVTWSGFFVALRRSTEEAALAEHAAQTPVAFALATAAAQ